MSESKWKQMAKRTTILRCLVGSQAYGLASLTQPCPFCVGRTGIVCSTCEDCMGAGEIKGFSDRDEKGVCIEDFEDAFPLNGVFEEYEFRTAKERTGKSDA